MANEELLDGTAIRGCFLQLQSGGFLDLEQPEDGVLELEVCDYVPPAGGGGIGWHGGHPRRRRGLNWYTLHEEVRHIQEDLKPKQPKARKAKTGKKPIKVAKPKPKPLTKVQLEKVEARFKALKPQLQEALDIYATVIVDPAIIAAQEALTIDNITQELLLKVMIAVSSALVAAENNAIIQQLNSEAIITLLLLT